MTTNSFQFMLVFLRIQINMFWLMKTWNRMVKIGFNITLYSPTWSTSNFLVGGLKHFLFFHILGIIIPIDFRTFQRSRYTTNQFWLIKTHDILWMEEILHHQKDGWNPISSGMFTTYQLVQDFATIHRTSTCVLVKNPCSIPLDHHLLMTSQ